MDFASSKQKHKKKIHQHKIFSDISISVSWNLFPLFNLNSYGFGLGGLKGIGLGDKYIFPKFPPLSFVCVSVLLFFFSGGEERDG